MNAETKTAPQITMVELATRETYKLDVKVVPLKTRKIVEVEVLASDKILVLPARKDTPKSLLNDEAPKNQSSSKN